MSIGKNQNTIEKRRREMNKKAKAEAKRIRRNNRKRSGDATNSPGPLDAEPKLPDATPATDTEDNNVDSSTRTN